MSNVERSYDQDQEVEGGDVHRGCEEAWDGCAGICEGGNGQSWGIFDGDGEEEKFRETLENGLKILEEEISTVDNNKKFSGKTAFKLYDTYGFPLDLTQDILKEKIETSIRFKDTFATQLFEIVLKSIDKKQ